ncbi:MAG: methylated-DNA--[protein]-cysteine S-methyltransferase [Acidimicrobiia bacterium]|nr:methylated-DNA--[protein]-cysteine S-methyltransferase [Acidimicrobiia bacterium]
MSTLTTTVRSPLGQIQLAGTEHTLTGLWFEERRHAPPGMGEWMQARQPFEDAIRQLGEYFEGSLRVFDVSVDQAGTAFQHDVWDALVRIPYGTTVSYADLAHRAGRPRAIRAAGAANGRNQISIIVPCHRAIGSNGSLTDYGGGLDRKRALLQLEGAI